MLRKGAAGVAIVEVTLYSEGGRHCSSAWETRVELRREVHLEWLLARTITSRGGDMAQTPSISAGTRFVHVSDAGAFSGLLISGSGDART